MGGAPYICICIYIYIRVSVCLYSVREREGGIERERQRPTPRSLESLKSTDGLTASVHIRATNDS